MHVPLFGPVIEGGNDGGGEARPANALRHPMVMVVVYLLYALDVSRFERTLISRHLRKRKAGCRRCETQDFALCRIDKCGAGG